MTERKDIYIEELKEGTEKYIEEKTEKNYKRSQKKSKHSHKREKEVLKNEKIQRENAEGLKSSCVSRETKRKKEENKIK